MNMPGFTATNSLCAGRRKYSVPRMAPERSGLAVEPQLRAGGGGSTDNCVDRYQNCYIDCSVRYPESNDSPNNLNALMRQGCFDSCDAAYRLCSPARVDGTIGQGIGRVARRAAPVVGRVARLAAAILG